MGRARARQSALRQRSSEGRDQRHGDSAHYNGNRTTDETETPDQHEDPRAGSIEFETPTQRAILNHLAMLQTPDEEPSDQPSRLINVTPQRRLIMQSSTDLRSPFIRDLPPLIESEQETESLPPDQLSAREQGNVEEALNSTVGSMQSVLFERHGLQHALGHRAPPTEVFPTEELRGTASAPASITEDGAESIREGELSSTAKYIFIQSLFCPLINISCFAQF